MTVVEWHPDELIDRRRAGTLSQQEQSKLDAHLAVCSACRFEVLVEQDFDGELAAFEAEIDMGVDASGEADGVSARHDVARLVRVATGLAAAPVANAPPRQTSSRARRGPWVAIAAAAVLLTGSAAALYRARADQAPATLVPVLDHAVESAVDHAHTQAAPRGSDDAARTGSDAPQDDAPASSAPVGAASSDANGAAALFARANEARRNGDDRRALALYRELEARHPGSPEAKLAHAIAGRLLLDKGDARGALDEYDRYLARGDATLGEEALVGRANALEKLGDRNKERAAWRALLAKYPTSIHAARAKARLAALK